MERREGTSGAFEELRNQNREAVSYADHSVDPDTIYQYRVYIGDSNGFGDYVQIQQRSEELDELTAPTDFKITYGTLNNGVYVANSPDPELEWEVGKASTGNRLTRKLIEPPAGITCQTPGDCPVMELMRQEGTRNTGYTDIYNGGGKHQYWIESIGRDGGPWYQGDHHRAGAQPAGANAGSAHQRTAGSRTRQRKRRDRRHMERTRQFPRLPGAVAPFRPG